MEFLTAEEALILTALGAHYHDSAVTENLKIILNQVHDAALNGHVETIVENLAADVSLPELINALRALGYVAKARSQANGLHGIDVSW